LAAAAIVAAAWIFYGSAEPQIATRSGKIEEISAGARDLKISAADEGLLSVSLDEASAVSDERGSLVSPSYLKKGFSVEVTGELRRGRMAAQTVRVTSAPNIIVYAPEPDETVRNPIFITGIARVFENTVNFTVRDALGNVIAEGFGTATGEIGTWSPFTLAASIKPPQAQMGLVEVFDYSAKDGSVENLFSVPVKFGPYEGLELKVYMNKPGVGECETVYPVTRFVPKTAAPARAALTELLSGVTPEEFRQGYRTSINQGVTIQRLTIENGVARADFDETLQASVGGSCRVAAIRAQIRKTLEQFPTVKSVVISIDGRTEDILQP